MIPGQPRFLLRLESVHLHIQTHCGFLILHRKNRLYVRCLCDQLKRTGTFGALSFCPVEGS